VSARRRVPAALSPWFAGAWRRQSIQVPGGERHEPCEAWWLQTEELFVDVRIALPGEERNGLPFSSTRAFAGRFETVDDGVRWHVVIDSDGPVPRSDGTLGVDLSLDPVDPRLMIEDAPGRFREEWIQQATGGEIHSIRTPDLIAVGIGDVCGAVWNVGDEVAGQIWTRTGLTSFGPPADHPPVAASWWPA
jgi:hypothetical protein